MSRPAIDHQENPAGKGAEQQPRKRTDDHSANPRQFPSRAEYRQKYFADADGDDGNKNEDRLQKVVTPSQVESNHGVGDQIVFFPSPTFLTMGVRNIAPKVWGWSAGLQMGCRT